MTLRSPRKNENLSPTNLTALSDILRTITLTWHWEIGQKLCHKLSNQHSLWNYILSGPLPVRRPEVAIFPWPARKILATEVQMGTKKPRTQCTQCRAVPFTLPSCWAVESPLHYSVSGPLFSVNIVDIYAPCWPVGAAWTSWPCLDPVDWSQEVLSGRLTLQAPGIAVSRSRMLKVKW